MNAEESFVPPATPRVLVDATALPEERGGVGRFLDELIEALSDQGVDLWLVCHPRDRKRFAASLPPSRIRTLPGWCAGRLPRLLWEQTGLPLLALKLRPHIVHSPHYTFPYWLFGRPRPARVVTVHDATFFSNPREHLPPKRVFFRWWLRRGTQRADLVITPSEATAREVLKWASRRPTASFVVVRHGVARDRFRPPTEEEIRAFRLAYDLASAPYIAFLGTLEPRKNAPALIRGWAAACEDRDHPPVLVLAGGQGWDSAIEAEVAALPAGLRVLRTGFLPDHFLPALLGGAEVVAYPSLGEGFGLPVLEAMACGACVLTTRALALPEVGGDAVAYTAPDDVALTEALRGLLDEPERRRRLRVAALRRSESFSWTAAAEGYLAAYIRAARSRSTSDGSRSGVTGGDG